MKQSVSITTYFNLGLQPSTKSHCKFCLGMLRTEQQD